LHEKIAELRSCIVSLEADLKVPIPTFCSTCELHAVKNLDLAECVCRLQDENDKLREVLSWLSCHEPQLGKMIANYKRFDGWALGFDKVGESSGEREGKFTNVPVPPQPTPKDKFASKPNQLLKPSEKPSGKPSEKPCEEPHPKPKPRPIRFHCEFVERMVTRESFAIREGERREWLWSGQTRTDTTPSVVCLSLVCRCPGPRQVREQFRLGESKRLQEVLLEE
jgi:hypothetical protein